MAFYLSFDSFVYLSNEEFGPDNHEKIMKKNNNKNCILGHYENCPPQGQSYCLKTNILFDGAVTAKVISSVMQDLIAIIGLYLCIEH